MKLLHRILLFPLLLLGGWTATAHAANPLRLQVDVQLIDAQTAQEINARALPFLSQAARGQPVAKPAPAPALREPAATPLPPPVAPTPVAPSTAAASPRPAAPTAADGIPASPNMPAPAMPERPRMAPEEVLRPLLPPDHAMYDRMTQQRFWGETAQDTQPVPTAVPSQQGKGWDQGRDQAGAASEPKEARGRSQGTIPPGQLRNQGQGRKAAGPPADRGRNDPDHPGKGKGLTKPPSDTPPVPAPHD